MMSSRLVFFWGLSVLMITVLSSCGTVDEDGFERSDWTVREGALQLEEDLRVSEDKNFYFGRIADVAVADDGRIYVTDNQAYHVKVLSPDGALQDSVGTRGDGPGEFQHPRDLTLARGDSLYVLDGSDGRVHVFTPGLAFERAFLARSERGRPINMMIPARAASSTDKAFLFVYSPGARAVVQEDAQMVVRPVSLGGTVGDTLFTTPPYRMASEDLGGGKMMFMTVPFMPGPHYALGPKGRVHYAWGDSLAVKAYGLEGNLHREPDIASDPVPVTDKEIDSALEGRSRGREQVRNMIPASKPAFKHFLVDDEGRYWFGRPTSDPDSTAWWVAQPDEQRVVTDTLSSTVRLMTIKSGHAYGRTTTEMGAPALVRYQIRSSK